MKKSGGGGGFLVVIIIVVAAVMFFTNDSDSSKTISKNSGTTNTSLGYNTSLNNSYNNGTTNGTGTYNGNYNYYTIPDTTYNTTVRTRCPSCTNGWKQCISCHGTGSLSRTHTAPSYGYGTGTTYETNQRCYACSGTGQVRCLACGGDGWL